MNSKKILGLGLVAALVSGGLTAASFAEGTFTFYKQPGATSTKMCTLTDAGVQRYNLNLSDNRPCDNDEASSVVMENVKRGTVLRVYDNQRGHKNDSWAEITIKQPHPHYVLHSFQSNYEDEFIKAEYHNDTNFMTRHGLNDQISRIEINETIPNFEK